MQEKKITKAFVFGKFMPFHKGHEAMINFALSHCDFLSVLICCSDEETLSCALRKSWMEATFRDHPRINIRTFQYDEKVLPNTSVSSTSVSAIWSERFKQLFPDYSLVVTSEPYGDMVADYMGIQHIPFDISKNLYPVSATHIRADLFKSWEYLPDSVKASLVTKVVLLGTESTGKTTLTGKLSAYFNSSAVMEAGRDLIPDSHHFSVADLYLVAREHAACIQQMETGPSPLVIIDTDIHITASYGVYALGEMLAIDPAIYAANKADLYLYLNNDVPYVQDGTRLSEAERDLLDQSHRQVLKQYDIAYEEITGDWEARFQQAEALINQLLQRKITAWHTRTLPSY